MPTTIEDKKVTELTVSDLKTLIRDVLSEIVDPDYGFELRPEVEKELRESLKQKERGEGVPLQEVKKRLGL